MRQGRRQGPHQPAEGGRAARPDHPHRRRRRPRGLRRGDRGGLRGHGAQAQGLPGDRVGRGARRPPVLQHLHAPHHHPRRGRAAPGRLHRAALLLAGRQDAARRDHQGRAHRRRGPRPRLRPRPADQQDPDRRQRLARLLHLPGDRPLHQRGRRHGRRGHRARLRGTGRRPGRLPGQGPLPDGRADPHPAAQDPQRDQAGRGGGRRHLGRAPGRGRRRPHDRRVPAPRPQRRRRLLRLRRGRPARRALAGPARALHPARPRDPVPGHAGAHALRRGAGHRAAAGGRGADLRGRRQHRFHPRHWLPRLDRRRAPVHQRLRRRRRGRRRPARLRGPRPRTRRALRRPLHPARAAGGEGGAGRALHGLSPLLIP
ncbi:hypothetical protein SGPA1_10308 [Streptomyces misionensis JCM 4497]